MSSALEDLIAGSNPTDKIYWRVIDPNPQVGAGEGWIVLSGIKIHLAV